MSRKMLIAFVAVVLVASGCSRGVSGPQKYAVDVDAKSTARDKFQFSAYFPGTLTVSPGDSVKFRNRSTEAPHTVSFGIASDRSNQPPILTDAGENPVVFAACSSDDEPTAKLTKCESEKLPQFDGTGYWNSGVLQPKPAPKSAGDKSVTLKIARDADPGEYTFVCILHPLMNGTLKVVADEGERTKPADARKAAREGAEEAAASAKKLETPKEERDGDVVVVAAGWGDRVTAVNRFGPPRVSVEAGTTVRWEIGSPYEPHTVTFESPYEVGDPKGFTPGGVASGSGYDGGYANSGIFGPDDSPFEGEFSLTFTKAGTYEYICLLHPGQKGAVTVT
jgi:plastocyanin